MPRQAVEISGDGNKPRSIRHDALTLLLSVVSADINKDILSLPEEDKLLKIC